MRFILTVIIVGMVALPGASFAKSRQNECHVLERQIAHYHDVVKMAKDRDDKLWAQNTQQQIDRLEARRESRCEVPKNNGAEQVAQFLQSAGKVALKLLALGLL